MSPSEDVKFSNVRGLYLRKYGTYMFVETFFMASLKLPKSINSFLCNLSIYKFETYNWKFSNWISWIRELTFAAKTRRNMIILENQLQETDILVRFSSFAFSHLMHNSGVPVAFKTWWEYQYMVGIICPPLFGLRCQNLVGTSPHVHRRVCILSKERKKNLWIKVILFEIDCAFFYTNCFVSS